MGNILYDLSVKIGTDLTGFYNGLKEAKGGLSSFGSAIGKGIGTVAKIGAAAAGAAATAATAFAASSVQVGASFDSAMSQVSATLGMTTDDIKNNVNGAGDTFQALRDKAEEAGRTTIFSASESAEGLNILAMSGYSAEESIAMLDDVLHLAAAGSMDMASAAGYVSGAMKGFNDDTKDSAYYADLMAKGATLANTNVQQLGEAMSSGAAGAAAYGQSAESMTVSLLRLAEQGEVGSAAGTALSAAMKNLYTPTNQAAGALKELGIAAYDESGAARDFNDVVNELDTALQGYTAEQQAAYKQTIFGIQGLEAYNKMTVTGTERQEEWAKALAESAGEASKQYDTMTDNLEGDVKGWNSALEGFQVAISDKLMPSIREFVQFGTGGLSKITDAFKSGGLDGAMEAFGQVLSDGIAMVVEELPKMVQAGGKLLSALGQGLTDNLDVLLKAAKDIFEYLLKGLVDATSDTSGIVEVLVKIGTALAKEAPVLLKALIDICTNVLTGLAGALPELIPAVIEAIIESVVTLLTNVDQFIAIAEAILVGIVQGLINSIPLLVQKIPEIWNMIVEAVTVTIPEAFMRVGQAIIDAITQGFAAHFPEASSKMSEIFGNIKSVIDGVVAWFAPFVSSIGNYLSALWGLITAVVGKIKESITAFLEEHKTIINAALITIKAIINGVLGFIKNYIMTVVTYVKNIITTALNLIAGIMKTVTSVLKGDWKGAWDNIKDTISTAITDVTRIFNDLVEGITKIWNGIIETARNWGHDMMQNIIDGIKNNPITGAIEGVASNIKDRLHFSEPDVGPLADFHTWAPDMMSLFAQGIKENEDLVRNQIEKSFDFSDVIATQNVSMAGNGGSSPVGNSIVMNIYPSAGMDEKALAKEISYRLSDQETRTKVIQRDTRTKATWRLANA